METHELKIKKSFFNFLKPAQKRFVARMSPEGLLLKNNRMILWKSIEAIEIVPKASLLENDQLLILLKDAKIVLANFDLPASDAHAVLTSYWQRFR